MEDMGPHIARNHPGMKVKLVKVKLVKLINNYEVKELRVMMPRLKKCRFCGLLGCGKPCLTIFVDSPSQVKYSLAQFGPTYQ